eukprot:COSAG03_NODE_26384_length_259_cov_0.968750_1_plen_62_part_01
MTRSTRIATGRRGADVELEDGRTDTQTRVGRRVDRRERTEEGGAAVGQALPEAELPERPSRS